CEGLDLLNEGSRVVLEAAIGDGDCCLTEMIRILNKLGHKRGLRPVIMEGSCRCRERGQRSGIERSLQRRVTLRNVYGMAMNAIDGTAEKLGEVGAEDWGADLRVGILDGSDLLAKLVGNDMGMQRGKIGDLGKGFVQPLLHAYEIRHYGVDLIRRDAS